MGRFKRLGMGRWEHRRGDLAGTVRWEITGFGGRALGCSRGPRRGFRGSVRAWSRPAGVGGWRRFGTGGALERWGGFWSVRGGGKGEAGARGDPRFLGRGKTFQYVRLLDNPIIGF